MKISKERLFLAAGVGILCALASFTAVRLRSYPNPRASKAKPGPERRLVPLAGPSRGPANALVNIVEFADFQCAFSKGLQPVLDRIQKEHADTVRLFFRQLPMPIHPSARLAAEASLAADSQGKFWEMHNELFTHQNAITRPELENYANIAGLDVPLFRAAMDGGGFRAQMEADLALAARVGARGTPTLFVNGRIFEGARSYEELTKIVDDELASARSLVAEGLTPEAVYGLMMTGATQLRGAGQRGDALDDRFKVPVGEAPVRGGQEPKVTIVEYADFECPFCSRSAPALRSVLDRFGNDVQVAFKHFPLRKHQRAELAAMAAESAREQGKFWEMHDKLFSNQTKLDRPTFLEYARALGLDMAKFTAGLESRENHLTINRDRIEALRFGVRGTPTVFLNGRPVPGEQTTAALIAAVQVELDKANKLMSSGVPRKGLYAAITKNGRREAEGGFGKSAIRQPQPRVTYRVEVGDAPTKGAADALVTIVEFADFQCAYCAELAPTIERIVKENRGRVRVVWKDFPLQAHQNATQAAVAARAAGKQGKFWEMHRALFAHHTDLSPDALMRIAKELHLNLPQFRAALEDEKLKAAVQTDAAQATALNVHGTPSLFINGQFTLGAESYASLKAKVEEAAARTQALLSRGIPKAKLYAELMRNARTSDTDRAPEPTATDNDTITQGVVQGSRRM